MQAFELLTEFEESESESDEDYYEDGCVKKRPQNKPDIFRSTLFWVKLNTRLPLHYTHSHPSNPRPSLPLPLRSLLLQHAASRALYIPFSAALTLTG